VNDSKATVVVGYSRDILKVYSTNEKNMKLEEKREKMKEGRRAKREREREKKDRIKTKERSGIEKYYVEK
jgi:hypothetical protein